MYLLHSIVGRVFLVPDDLAVLDNTMWVVQYAMELPWHEAIDQVEEYERRVGQDRGSLLMSRALSGLLSPVRPAAEAEALQRLAALAIAAARYKVERGAYPAELTCLVPDYVLTIPLDPFDGEPLRMKAESDGLVLYSIFENRKDDGGAFDWESGKAEDGDLAFCLGSAYVKLRLKPSRNVAEAQ